MTDSANDTFYHWVIGYIYQLPKYPFAHSPFVRMVNWNIQSFR